MLATRLEVDGTPETGWSWWVAVHLTVFFVQFVWDPKTETKHLNQNISNTSEAYSVSLGSVSVSLPTHLRRWTQRYKLKH